MEQEKYNLTVDGLIEILTKVKAEGHGGTLIVLGQEGHHSLMPLSGVRESFVIVGRGLGGEQNVLDDEAEDGTPVIVLEQPPMVPTLWFKLFT